MNLSTCDELRPQAASEGTAELGFEWTYRQANVRRLEDVTTLLNDVVAALVGLDYSPTDCLGIRLALGEAVVNGLRHGNRCDPGKCVRICYWVSPAALLAEVEDEGSHDRFLLDRLGDLGVTPRWLASRLIAQLDDYLIETTLTVALAFGAYVVAERLGVEIDLHRARESVGDA